MNSYEEEKITFLIDDLLAAIRQVDEDEEARIYSLIKQRFKYSDDQITRKVMKYFYHMKSDFRPALKKSIDLTTVEPLTYLMDGMFL